jgi:hypothetical protein
MGSRVQGESWIFLWFTLCCHFLLSVRWTCSHAPTWFPLLEMLPYPQTILQVPFGMGTEFPTNLQKARLNRSVKSKCKHGKTATHHSLNAYGLVYVWVYTCVGFPRSHANQSRTNYLCDWIPHDLKQKG